MNFWFLKITKTDPISDNEKEIMEKYLTGLADVLHLYIDYISVQKQFLSNLCEENGWRLLVYILTNDDTRYYNTELRNKYEMVIINNSYTEYREQIAPAPKSTKNRKCKFKNGFTGILGHQFF